MAAMMGKATQASALALNLNGKPSTPFRTFLCCDVLMSVVDARVDDGFFSVGQAEALKTLIATSDVPLGPGPMFGPPPGAFMRGGHGFGEEDRFFPVRGGDKAWIIQTDDGTPADDEDDGDTRSDQNANEDDSQANEDDASS
jgi:hypothetical protein